MRILKDPRHRTQALFARLDKISRQITAKPTPEAVHQLRTTVRRVETLVAANSTGAKHSKLLKQLKTLRRRGGKVRDVDVQVLALRSIRVGHKREKLEVRHALEQLRKKRSRKLVKAIEDATGSGLRKRLKATAAALSAPQADAGSNDHAGALASALDKFANMATEYPPLSADNLHQFRMECKRIRYLAEIESDHPAAEQVVNLFKRIQDAIGEWHDWVNLEQTAEEVLASPNSPLLAAVRAGKQAKFNEALRVTGDVKIRVLDLRAAIKRQDVRSAPPTPIPFRMRAVAG